jgi:glucose-1-phosphate cytidylyltransferase
VSYQPDGRVTGISDVRGGDLWVNGGYFFFRQEVFDYIDPGEDLVEEPFRRLVAAGELLAYRYEGFWTALDTLKDLQSLEALHDSGHPPWAPWTSRPGRR